MIRRVWAATRERVAARRAERNTREATRHYKHWE